jgi:hypothetical protein
MKDMSDDLFVAVRDYVIEECAKRGIDGVFAMCEIASPVSKVYYACVQRDSPLDNASDGRFYNLAAIAWSKISVVVSHRVPSGGYSKYEGETNYRGGILSKDGRFAYAFSGATEDQDVEIAKVAYNFHKALI